MTHGTSEERSLKAREPPPRLFLLEHYFLEPCNFTDNPTTLSLPCCGEVQATQRAQKRTLASCPAPTHSLGTHQGSRHNVLEASDYSLHGFRLHVFILYESGGWQSKSGFTAEVRVVQRLAFLLLLITKAPAPSLCGHLQSR